MSEQESKELELYMMETEEERFNEWVEMMEKDFGDKFQQEEEMMSHEKTS